MTKGILWGVLQSPLPIPKRYPYGTPHHVTLQFGVEREDWKHWDGFLDIKYHENGNIELFRVNNNSDSEELIAQGEEVLAIVNYGVYEELNSYSIRNPHISISALLLKAKELILWEQIHGDD